MPARKPIPSKLSYEIKKRDGFRCRACGKTPKEGAILEVDHIIPVALGGTDDPSNLQTLCQKCNRGKSDTHPNDFSYLNKNKQKQMPVNPLILIQAATVIAPVVFKALSAVGDTFQNGGSMFNIRFPTLGGNVWWHTVAEQDGWKVQQNKVFGNCRILAPDNWRIAWGGGGALDTFVEQLPALVDAVAEAQRRTEEGDEEYEDWDDDEEDDLEDEDSDEDWEEDEDDWDEDWEDEENEEWDDDDEWDEDEDDEDWEEVDEDEE